MNKISLLSVVSFLSLFLAGCQSQHYGSFGADEHETVRYQHSGSGHIERALASDDALVLFFGTSWCPTCRALDEDIARNIAQIPSNLRILTFDFDKDTAWKDHYKVFSTHSLIYLDSSGYELTRSVKRDKTLAAILDRISLVNTHGGDASSGAGLR